MTEPKNILPLNARSIRFRWRGWSYDYSFDDEFLTSSSGWRGFSQTTKTPLWRLMQDFVEDTPVSDVARRHMRRLRYSLAAALVVQFSNIPQHVPYLAPALFAFAGYSIIRGARHTWPTKQTRVLTNYGDQIISIPHLKLLETGRQRFEEQLRSAIEAAKARNDE